MFIISFVTQTVCSVFSSHFHVLTHSLKISFNPSLVAGFSLKAQRNQNIRVRKRAVLQKTLAVNGTKSLLTMFLFARQCLISHFFFIREEIRATCSISKKQLVITQVPLCKQATRRQYQSQGCFFLDGWEPVPIFVHHFSLFD